MDPEEQSPSKQQRLSGPVSVSPPHGANIAGAVGQLHPNVAPRVIAPKPPLSNAPGGGPMPTAASPYGQPAAMVQPMQNVQRVVKPMVRQLSIHSLINCLLFSVLKKAIKCHFCCYMSSCIINLRITF